jgi:TonB family protein
MGYQALLFCPDEKAARSVTQVLSELDFTVVPCTEPFGAVKKLMGEHFDAVVVDCDNEQNATLLFKSARNTPNNQSSLAVAVVEGQAGVAKAFRIGANLVLTKPINVEQAKGTLRVARGLLRKSEAGKPAAPAGAPAAGATAKPAKPVPTPPKPAAQAPTKAVATPRPAPPAAPLAKAATASVPSQKPPQQQTRVVAAVPTGINESNAEIPELGHEVALPPVARPGANVGTAKIETAKIETTKIETKTAVSHAEIPSPRPSAGLSHASSGGFGSGAGSAPAPAREPEHRISTEDKPSAAILEPASATGKVVADLQESAEENTASIDGASAPPSSFTFGGNVEEGGSKTKKTLLMVGAAVFIAVAGAAIWLQWVRSSGAPTPFEHPVVPVKTAAPVSKAAPSTAPAATSPVTSSATTSAASSLPSSTPEPVAAPQSAGAAKSASDSDAPSAEDAEDAPAHPSKVDAKANSAKASAPAANKAAATKGAAPAIVIKNDLSQKSAAKPAATTDEAAPSMNGIASADGGGSLPNLMGGDSNAPAPVLGTLTVSQGVSRGLLVKKTQPSYPASAMQLKIEGAVELLATISKDGNISAVKIVSGDPHLARAAVDAVKQWKYKPYLLNGEPVEIQTQITMNFKLPN